jgi:hypothetical protein
MRQNLTIVAVTVLFIGSVFNGLVSAAFIGKFRLSDHHSSRKANLTAKDGDITKDLIPYNNTNTKNSGLVTKYPKAIPLPSGDESSSQQKPKPTTSLTNGTCIAAPFRITVQHSFSETEICARKFRVNMCLGYCRSYTVPHEDRVKPRCFCCKGKTRHVDVTLNCGGRQVIKKVPTVDECRCRPCSEF